MESDSDADGCGIIPRITSVIGDLWQQHLADKKNAPSRFPVQQGSFGRDRHDVQLVAMDLCFHADAERVSSPGDGGWEFRWLGV